MLTVIKKILWSLVIVSGVIGLVTILVATEAGLRFAATIASKLVPGKVIITELHGKIIGPIELRGLRYEDQSQIVTLEQLYLDWQPLDLLIHKVHFNSVKVVGLKYSNKVTAHAKPQQSAKFRLPRWQFQLDQASLNNFIWQNGTGSTFKIDQLNAQTTLSQRMLQIDATAKAAQAKLELHGKVQKEWQLLWRLNIPELKQIITTTSGSIVSAGEITGPKNTPNIYAKLQINKLRYREIALEKLASELFFVPANFKNSRLNITADNLSTKSQALPKITLTGSANIDKQGQEKVLLSIVAPILKLSNGQQPRIIALPTFLLNFILQKNGLLSELTIKSPSPYNLSAQLFLPHYDLKNVITPTQKLTGKLECQTTDLRLLQQFSSDIKNLQGALHLTANVDGTIAEPKLNWQLNYANGTVNLPLLRLQLVNINSSFVGTNNQIEYSSRLTSGGGQLQVRGGARFSKTAYHVQAEISGNNVLVANTDEYKLIIAPRLQLSGDEKKLNLTGTIVIPQASLKPHSLSGDVELPPETVFVQAEPQEKAVELPLYSKVQLLLGKNVSFVTMGLSGKAEGALQLLDEPKRVTTGLGVIQIKDATYNIYGQDLKVTAGSFNFNGGPVNNPEINLRAVREFRAIGSSVVTSATNQELTVGLQAHGPLDNTAVDLFSVPAGLSKTDILSYLILGQPASTASTEGTQLLFKAASTLNISGTGEISQVVTKLRQQLGLSELGLTTETKAMPTTSTANPLVPKSTNNLTTSTALMLGKYLTPKIYVSYSMGLLDPMNIFRVRYFINKEWSVQSESSGLGNGVDLLYSIER